MNVNRTAGKAGAGHGPSHPRPELLAPAGELDAAYAAFQYGADAVYCGLRRFSARAEAVNLAPEELNRITAYAHAQTPRRRVFVTLNIVVLNREMPQVVEALGDLSDIGVDAVIVQDLGIFRIIRRHFPNLEVHASTQMAIHNLAGARALAGLGFRRVTLARELTLAEIRAITASAGIETEVFVHGALCYSYSGLCLFSSLLRGRSGNRGRCAYPCRDAFRPAADSQQPGLDRIDPAACFPFSMKDLALPEYVHELHAAGVACLKIEGRMKSPLYVAAVTDFYKRVRDGHPTESVRRQMEDDLKTIFSRPWTRLHLQSAHDKTAVDPRWVGHRGARIGKVEAVLPAARGPARLRFRASRSLERHDGLQIDLPGQGRPFGFPVDSLRVLTGPQGKEARSAFEAPSGSHVEVDLPAEHPPIPVGAPLYCSSSQAVKRRFPIRRPKPTEYQVRLPVDAAVVVTPGHLQARARARACECGVAIEANVTTDNPFPPAGNPAAMETSARQAFEKLGHTEFALNSFEFDNPHRLFVPVSLLNALRRDLTSKIEAHVAALRQQRLDVVKSEVLASSPAPSRQPPSAPRWSIKIDRTGLLDAFTQEDLDGVHEAVVDIEGDPLPRLTDKLKRLAERLGRGRVRLALPMITRAWEQEALIEKVHALREAGWQKWAAANLSAWNYLSGALAPDDLAADWSVYVQNRAAALQVLDMGASGFTLSPEDGIENLREMLGEFPDRATVIVYQDSPLFISESCAFVNLQERCAGPGQCRFATMNMDSSRGEKIVLRNFRCRTVALNRAPYCLAGHGDELSRAGVTHVRADFVFKEYAPESVAEIWRLLRAGRRPPQCHDGNFARG